MFILYFNQAKLPKDCNDCKIYNMIAKYIKELPYAYQDMNEAFRVVRKVLEKQLTTRNIL